MWVAAKKGIVDLLSIMPLKNHTIKVCYISNLSEMHRA